MKTRKIVLLGAVVVLACAFVIELLATPSGSVKSLALREQPDSILIEKGGGKLLLSLESPYLFYVSEYDITRLLKPLADLTGK